MYMYIKGLVYTSRKSTYSITCILRTKLYCDEVLKDNIMPHPLQEEGYIALHMSNLVWWLVMTSR